MFIKLYRSLSGRNLRRFIPRFILNIIKKIIYKLSKNVVKINYEDYVFCLLKESCFNFLLKGKFGEKGTSKLIYEYTSGYDVFIDVGACLGFYTLIAKSNFKISIEPE